MSTAPGRSQASSHRSPQGEGTPVSAAIDAGMKYVTEFRDGELARRMADSLAAEVRPGQVYSFMEFCGGHTHAISRYGVLELLPPNVRMIHGPGCPVCVLPIGRVDQAIFGRRAGITAISGIAHRQHAIAPARHVAKQTCATGQRSAISLKIKDNRCAIIGGRVPPRRQIGRDGHGLKRG